MHILLTLLVVPAALVVSVGGGWAVTVGVLSLAQRYPEGHRPAPDDVEQPRPAEPTAVLRGGTWIGILERLWVTGALIVGQPGAIAVLVALKGLGRYPEIRNNPAASERFVLGTLASVLWSAFIGWLAAAALHAW